MHHVEFPKGRVKCILLPNEESQFHRVYGSTLIKSPPFELRAIFQKRGIPNERIVDST
jgi:hypothetical protein